MPVHNAIHCCSQYDNDKNILHLKTTHNYTGRDMHCAHTHLHLIEVNFEDPNEDLLITLRENRYDQEAIDEAFNMLNR